MTLLLSLSSGIERRFSQTLTRVAGEISVSSKDAPAFGGIFVGGGATLPSDYVEQIRQLDYVEGISARVSLHLPPEALKTDNPFGVPLLGVEGWVGEDNPPDFITEGRFFEDGNEVVVGAHINEDALFFGGKELKVGDVLEVPGRERGEIFKLEVVGLFETKNFLVDGAIYGKSEMVRKISGISEGQISSITVKADKVKNAEGLAGAIEDLFVEAEPPVNVSVSRNLLKSLSDSVGILNKALLAISLVAAVAGGMSILIVMLMSVLGRMREFGILKASGWSNFNIISSVLVESIFLAFLGALLGFGLGLLGVNILIAKVGPNIAILTPILVFRVIAFGIFMGVIGGIYPALRAARVSPIETLRG